MYMDTHIDVLYNIIVRWRRFPLIRRPNTVEKEGVPMPEEKKSTYTGQTDARRRANAKYLHETVEDIRIRVPRGEKAKIQAHAASTGESTNAFVVRAISETMERDSQEGK